jgi:hypothetical protein
MISTLLLIKYDRAAVALQSNVTTFRLLIFRHQRFQGSVQLSTSADDLGEFRQNLGALTRTLAPVLPHFMQ